MIKNIIFDITGVLLNFSRDALINKYYKGKYYDSLKEAVFHNWELMDEGLLTPEEHLKQVLNSLPSKLHKVAKDILSNWEDTMYYTEGIQELIAYLKNSNYKLYVLSNMTEHFIKNQWKFNIFNRFDGIVYSAPIKLIKPDKKIYEYILKKYDLEPTECIFVDDRKENLTAAARFSINTFLFDNNANELKKFILSF